jgi:phosphoglycerate dehydrogenase-like enzyme
MTKRLKVLMTCDAPELAAFGGQIAEADFLATSDRAAMLREVPDAQIVCIGDWDAELLAAAHSVRWIHAMCGGVSHYLFPEMRRHPAPLTCCKGTFDVAGAEHGLALMLLFTRGLLEDLRRTATQGEHHAYDLFGQGELCGKTLGILGLGGMGTALATRARCLGMRVIATRRRPGPTPVQVDELLSADRRHDLLRQSDFVAVAVPLTPQTKGLIGAAELQAMKSTAFLIDLSGRDAIFDLDAVARALREGWIAGGAIQLQGPPPHDSPLRGLTNFLYVRQRAVSREQYDRMVEQFRENMQRYRRGAPLVGVVDKELGY